MQATKQSPAPPIMAPDIVVLAEQHGAALKTEPSRADKMRAGFRRMLADMKAQEDRFERAREAADCPACDGEGTIPDPNARTYASYEDKLFAGPPPLVECPICAPDSTLCTGCGNYPRAVGDRCVGCRVRDGQ
jgi:rubrerythrin